MTGRKRGGFFFEPPLPGLGCGAGSMQVIQSSCGAFPFSELWFLSEVARLRGRILL